MGRRKREPKVHPTFTATAIAQPLIRGLGNLAYSGDIDIGMRVALVLAAFVLGPLTLPAGPSDTSASRLETPQVTSALSADQERRQSLVSETQVRAWVRKWQRRLGLEEWQIESRIVRTADLPKGAIANIHWSLPKRRATVKVLNSLDSNLKDSEIPRDTELSVIHELVHLSMARLPLDPNNTDLEEETVKRLSAALLDLQEQQDALSAARHAQNGPEAE